MMNIEMHHLYFPVKKDLLPLSMGVLSAETLQLPASLGVPQLQRANSPKIMPFLSQRTLVTDGEAHKHLAVCPNKEYL